MTHEERVVVSAYTGFLMCSFSSMHKYIEDLLGRPILTHELAQDDVRAEIKEKCKPAFLALCGD